MKTDCRTWKQVSDRLCLVALFALASAAGGKGEDVSSSAGQCAINAVYGTFATGGRLAATGFAFDSEGGAPVRKVALYLDGSVPGEVSLRGLRPDVRTHFGREDYLWSGWNGTLSLEGVKPGSHTVTLVATSDSGKAIPCGEQAIQVVDAPTLPDRPPLRIAGEIVLRTLLFLAWAALVGWAPAVVFRVRPWLAAPFLGLSFFGVFAEMGAALHVRPFHSALGLTFFSLVALIVVSRSRGFRFRPPVPEILVIVAFVALFAVCAVLPLARHGEGAVLGDIDDASRECVAAASISRYGWNVPPDVQGYLSSMRYQIEVLNWRRGGIYLLSALADAFRVPAHAIFSVAMLASGCLIVWGSGLLAREIAVKRPKRWWLAPALAFVNSTILGALFGQHLGTLLAAVLLLAFLAFLLRLARRGDSRSLAATAILVAAAITFYPEALPLWGMSALLAVAASRGIRRRRAVHRIVLAFILGALINPVGFVRFVRYAQAESRRFSTSTERTMTGDTHYYPSPAVIWGIQAYREDAPAPMGSIRRVLVPLGALVILLAALLGWRRLSHGEKAAMLVLLVPMAVALLGNALLRFPYGYSKFLPMGSAIWSVAFAVLVSRALEEPLVGAASAARKAVAGTALTLAFLLALPSARHVWSRAMRAVPGYDPDYRVLPALAGAVGRGAVIIVDEPLVASRAWMSYFFGENAVFDSASAAPPGASRRYRLFDRRKDPRGVIGPGSVSSRPFALVPSESPTTAPP